MDKLCSACNITKELDQFPRGARYTDGRRGVCKICTKNYSKTFCVKEGEYLCTICNKTLKHTEFYKCSSNKNGLRTTCKTCNPLKNNFKFKYDNNKNLRISHNLRTRIRNAVKHPKGTKSAKTLELVGCTVEDLCLFLEAEFTEGMTWVNYGDWHIDHMRPCASFDLEDPEEQKRCFHWTNLQPLWAQDNLRKGAKIVS